MVRNQLVARNRLISAARWHANHEGGGGIPLAGPASAAPTEPKPVFPIIAVLPFTYMSGDPEQEYFSDGITEDIITDLSKVAGLLVNHPQLEFHLQGQEHRYPYGRSRTRRDRGAGRIDKAGRQSSAYYRSSDRRQDRYH